MPITEAEAKADMETASATQRAMEKGKLAEEMQITRTVLLGKASEAGNEEIRQFYRDRADHLENLIGDLIAGRETDTNYCRMIVDEFSKL